MLSPKMAPYIKASGELAHRSEMLLRLPASPSSPARQDEGRPLGYLPLTMSATALSFAKDHLLAWRKLQRGGGKPDFAHVTVLRSMLEGAVTCRWVLDPSNTSDERILRASWTQLDDLENRRKFEDSIGATNAARPPGAKSGADRKRELQLEMERLDMPLRPLNMTDLFERYAAVSGSGGFAYRLAGAFAHNRPWAFLVSVIEPQPGASDFQGTRGAKITADERVSLLVAKLSQDCFAAALRDLATYKGV